MRPIRSDKFYHDGRGPELLRAYYDERGVVLRAIEFCAPAEQNCDHLVFIKVQAFMFTAEEVHNSTIPEIGNSALLNLGQSQWFKSFHSDHLSACSHFHLIFYDEYLDVICEDVDVRGGAFAPEQRG